MGFGQSKPVKKFGEDLQDVDILDIIATKYILTQNFQDMKKLGSKEYCDKLVILTSKIIKKYMNEKEIKYLAQRITDGNYYNEMTKEKVIYLDTNELSSKSNKRFSKKELDEFKKYNENDDKSSDLRKTRDDMGDYERREIYRNQSDYGASDYGASDYHSRDNRARDNRARDNRARDNH